MFSGQHKRGFLNILGYYSEPMCLKRQTRLFLYLGVKVSVFDVAPGFRRSGGVTDGNTMPVTPMLIDMSL